ncbi:MAG: Di-heme cytochrome c peroxidase [Proteobacteria bacterium]|nr:Di-heme cytochrome c peroxidase [Pseudomonadota bacterium]
MAPIYRRVAEAFIAGVGGSVAPRVRSPRVFRRDSLAAPHMSGRDRSTDAISSGPTTVESFLVSCIEAPWRKALRAAAIAGGLALLLPPAPASAQFVEPIRPLDSLKKVPTPEPANLTQFLRTNNKGLITAGARAAAIALGKALFWDQAAGSDGQACASCHYNAGADSRTRNQLDPGLRAIPAQSVWGAKPPQQTTGVGVAFAPDYQLQASDFPLLKFTIAGDRASGIASDTQAVVSSAGVFNSVFGDVTPSPCPNDQLYLGVSICDRATQDLGGNGAIFNRASPPTSTGQVRNVEPRNTPSIVNAVFNFRNFWDGRARNEFNGVSPIGDLDPYARVLLNPSKNTLQKVALSGSLRLENASLASQAVGPALSDMEMSAQQRSFAKLGKKLLALPMALPAQIVALDDSVLGSNATAGVRSNYPSTGINKSYADLIQAAFQPKWYGSNQIITFGGGTDADGTVTLVFSKPPRTGTTTTDQFTQMEFNFSLFWGIAIQMYEATLRADDSAMDQAFDSGNPLTFSSIRWGDLEKQGMNVFQGAGRCINCHSGPETTNAALQNIRQAGIIEMMTMGDLGNAHYDDGFYNIAVRRCLDQTAGPAACDDVGIGATIGPLNLPLSVARLSQMVAAHDPNNPKDPITIMCANQPTACSVPAVGTRVAVDGALKVPGLRNVELTAPYMHNGGELGLRDVVQFYDRGGNFPDYNIRNLDPDIGNIVRDPGSGQMVFGELGLSSAEMDAVVAFLKAMTDERVRFQRAPFDHPQLFVPNLPPDPNCPQCKPGELPAVGRSGITVYGSSAPLPTFAENLQ